MTERKTKDTFRSELKEMSEAAPMGSFWVHISSGKLYRVVSHCWIEATAEPSVIYADLQVFVREGDLIFPTWVRPFSEFIEKFKRVEINV